MQENNIVLQDKNTQNEVARPKAALPRMRTIQEAHLYIKQLDEESSVSEYLIRQLCKQSQVHCVMTGKSILWTLTIYAKGYSKT